jgi:TRAP-type C4-dicarboxylate transport system permease small subunit
VFVWQGVRLTITTWSLEFPAMEISRGYLYASLPVGACLMGLAIFQRWRGRGLEVPKQEERP